MAALEFLIWEVEHQGYFTDYHLFCWFSSVHLGSVQFSHSVISDSVTPWTAAFKASLSITSSWSLLKFMSIESGTPSYHLILCCPLLLLPSIFPTASVSSLMSQFFTWGGQIIVPSASVLPMNIQDWFLLGLTSLMSFQSKGLSRVFSNITIQKHHFFSTHSPLWPNSHTHTRLLEKP